MSRKNLFPNGEMSLGVNYWVSNAATRMWTEWDENVIENDIKNLAKIGCEYLRVFPLWPDFQPVMVLRSNCFKGGYKRGYAFTGERPLPNTEAGRAGVDETMMERFETLCAWEIGNESNCLSSTDERTAAWSWSAFVTDAIRAEDNTRPVCSGMHSLALNYSRNNSWTFDDQAELCDVLTSHPYPMWRPYVNCDRPNTLRWVLFTPVENQLYADISNSGAFAEEVGTLRRTFSTFEMLGDHLRNVLWLLWGNNSRALLWWCAFDQTKMEFPPYDWDEAGMEHGVMTADYKVNPTGRAIADFAVFKNNCPIKALPEPKEKAVCILGRDCKLYELAHSVGVMAAQAGLPIKYTYCEADIPDSKVYLIPSAIRKGGLNRAAYKKLAEKVENGATVYMSFDYNTCIPLMEEFFGLEIESREQIGGISIVNIQGIPEIKVNPKYKFTVKSHGAVPLDPDGFVWEYKRGKGRVITAALPFEMIMLGNKDSYRKYPAYELYRMIGKDIIKNNILCSTDSEVIITEHPENENTVYAVVCNCSPDKKQVRPTVKDGWRIEKLYSDNDGVKYSGGVIEMPNNSGALLVLKGE